MPAPDGRSDHVLALAKRGVRPCEIAEQTGLSSNAVYTRLAYYRRHGCDIPRFTGGPRKNGTARLYITDVAPDLRNLLEPHAARRDQTINELARDLLDMVAREGLVDAILDDGESQP